MSRRMVILCLGLLAIAGRAAALPDEAESLREAFKQRLGQIEQGYTNGVAALGEEYLADLRKLEDRLEAAGGLRGLVAVHDERVRFADSHQFAAGAPPDVPDLAGAQARYLDRFNALSRSNETAVVAAAGDYLQALHRLKARRQFKGDDAGVQALDAERDRLLALPRLRRALRATSGERGAPASDIGLAGKPHGETRELKMYRMSDENVTTVVGYDLAVELTEDRSALNTRKAESDRGVTESLSGKVRYVPRVTITCRNAEIPPGSRLVLDYFSRSLTDGERAHEGEEVLPLPAVARGETCPVEGDGVRIARSESTTTNTGGVRNKRGAPWGAQSGGSSGRSYSGGEFYGLVATVLDPSGEVLFRRFSPQSLEREIRRSAADTP